MEFRVSVQFSCFVTENFEQSVLNDRELEELAETYHRFPVEAVPEEILELPSSLDQVASVEEDIRAIPTMVDTERL